MMICYATHPGFIHFCNGHGHNVFNVVALTNPVRLASHKESLRQVGVNEVESLLLQQKYKARHSEQGQISSMQQFMTSNVHVLCQVIRIR